MLLDQNQVINVTEYIYPIQIEDVWQFHYTVEVSVYSAKFIFLLFWDDK